MEPHSSEPRDEIYIFGVCVEVFADSRTWNTFASKWELQTGFWKRLRCRVATVVWNLNFMLPAHLHCHGNVSLFGLNMCLSTRRPSGPWEAESILPATGKSTWITQLVFSTSLSKNSCGFSIHCDLLRSLQKKSFELILEARECFLVFVWFPSSVYFHTILRFYCDWRFLCRSLNYLDTVPFTHLLPE